jgi:two-component system sporulation sensor kinase B
MINYYKDFFLNIFFVFSPLVFYPYILKIKNRVFVHGLLKYLLLAIALISTMSFPIPIGGVNYDFRSIPLSIGILYGGPLVTFLLYLTLVLYRFMMGNPNNLLYLLSLLPSLLLLSLFIKRYTFFKLKMKVAFVVLACTLIKLMTITTYLAIDNNLQLVFNNPLSTLEIYLLHGLIAGVFVCLLEYIIRHYIMQEEIIATEKIKIVSDIAASVAHEIRNPLTSVRGFIQLLGNDELLPQRREYYQKISLEELDRAQNIITDYLSLAKPDPEQIDRIHLKDEVEYVSNILLTYANYNNVVINAKLSEGVYVEGDRQKLRQALINIGKNAIEAMTGGGDLQLILKKLNDTAILTISDTGVGMTTTQISKLGTPYYSTKEKGTGLGTMVSFGIIKKMQGKIEIQSEPGKGTQFQIIFAVLTD